MNKDQIVDKLRSLLNGKYTKTDGLLDYTQIFKDTGIQPNQIKALYGNAKNPSINMILSICEVTGMTVFIE